LTEAPAYGDALENGAPKKPAASAPAAATSERPEDVLASILAQDEEVERLDKEHEAAAGRAKELKEQLEEALRRRNLTIRAARTKMPLFDRPKWREQVLGEIWSESFDCPIPLRTQGTLANLGIRTAGQLSDLLGGLGADVTGPPLSASEVSSLQRVVQQLRGEGRS
jgi:hypothetical protein